MPKATANTDAPGADQVLIDGNPRPDDGFEVTIGPFHYWNLRHLRLPACPDCAGGLWHPDVGQVSHVACKTCASAFVAVERDGHWVLKRSARRLTKTEPGESKPIMPPPAPKAVRIKGQPAQNDGWNFDQGPMSVTGPLNLPLPACPDCGVRLDRPDVLNPRKAACPTCGSRFETVQRYVGTTPQGRWDLRRSME